MKIKNKKEFIFLKKYPFRKWTSDLCDIPYIELKARSNRVYLAYIKVPDKLLKKGFAIKLMQELFFYMESNKIKKVYFTNLNKPFWKKMSKKFPHKIKIKTSMCGEIIS